MRSRLFDYLRAVETGTTDKYHDYQDVVKGRLSIKGYERKWGKYHGIWRPKQHE